MSRPHFVVSTGRCGSTLMSNILRLHPSVLSLSELFAALEARAFPDGPVDAREFWQIVSEPGAAARALIAHRAAPLEFLYPVDGGGRFSRETGVPPISMTFLPFLSDDPDGLYDEIEAVVRDFPTAEIGAQYVRLFDWLAIRLDKQLWIERSGGSLVFVEALIRSFPSARFVHIYRDGRASAVSMSKAPVFRMHHIRRLLESELGYDPYVSLERPAPGLLPAELELLLPESFDREAFSALPISAPTLGRLWSTMILRGTRQLAALPPADVLHVSFERLVEATESEVARLLAFLDLEEPSDDWIASAAALVERRRSAWADLPAEELRELERACEPGTARLGAIAAGSLRTRNGGGPTAGDAVVREGTSRSGVGGRLVRLLTGAGGQLPPGPGRFSDAGKRFLSEPESLLTECQARYGDCFTLHLSGIRSRGCPVVLIADPDALKALFRAGPDLCQVIDSRERVRRIVGEESVFMLDGRAHVRRRRLLLPHFHGEALRRSHDLIAEATDRQIDLWPLDQPFPLSSSMFSITFEVLARSVFGIDDLAWHAHLRRLVHGVSQPWLGPTLPAREPERARAALAELLYAEIARHRSDAIAAERRDVLSLLVGSVDEDGRPLDDRQIHDELMTLLFAAHETAAVGVTWTLSYLLRDAVVLERARQEAIAGEHAYIDAIAKEGLRLKPPVPVITRTLIKQWRVAGFELPAGTVVAPCIYLVNRRVDVYPGPDEFRPERILESGPDTYAWLPFGGGVRRCIGASFAEFEMRVILQRLLARTHLELVDPVPPAGRWSMAVLAPGRTQAVLRRRVELAR